VARRVFAAAFLAIVGAATLAPQVDAEQQVCTEIGCNSSIVVHVSREVRQEPAAELVRVCALSKCKERQMTGTVVAMPCGGVKAERRARVRVALFDDQGERLWKDGTWVHLVRNQPNGPNCPPVCFQASVRLIPSAQEVRPT
jgi:hypothetical protein